MLREARKKAGLTMKELGIKVGVSESAISQYENGRREADFETLLKIGEVLNCSIDFLLRGQEEKPVTEDDEPDEEEYRELKALILDSNKEGRAEILRAIKLLKSMRE